jgi:hypothetical protein
MNDTNEPPAYKFRTQRSRIEYLSEQLEAVSSGLHRAAEAAKEVVRGDSAVLGELAVSEQQDLLNHLERSAEFVRSAERVVHGYWIVFDKVMEREKISLHGNVPEV